MLFCYATGSTPAFHHHQESAAYVLLFKAFRLMVIETEGGIPLFTHDWKKGKNLERKDLFPGMVQGFSLILGEAAGEGEIQEIRLKNAIILIEKMKQHPVAIIASVIHLPDERAQAIYNKIHQKRR